MLPVPCGDPAAEKAKLDAAIETARQQLSDLFEKAKVELGEEKAAIVEVQMLMLDDLDYLDAESCGTLAVDGFTGTWYADPDAETLAAMQAKQ